MFIIGFICFIPLIWHINLQKEKSNVHRENQIKMCLYSGIFFVLFHIVLQFSGFYTAFINENWLSAEKDNEQYKKNNVFIKKAKKKLLLSQLEGTTYNPEKEIENTTFDNTTFGHMLGQQEVYEAIEEHNNSIVYKYSMAYLSLPIIIVIIYFYFACSHDPKKSVGDTNNTVVATVKDNSALIYNFNEEPWLFTILDSLFFGVCITVPYILVVVLRNPQFSSYDVNKSSRINKFGVEMVVMVLKFAFMHYLLKKGGIYNAILGYDKEKVIEVVKEVS
jgi:hypothetical protein